ncbi:MAG: hypothetical protein DMG79_05890 [Acidobacteria bacterium]|nr:MAG: hypothetical protein DMG79_05890 [Acidobacteriota bacterium]
MKKIGFLGVAEATTFRGEGTLDPSVGFDTVSGKSFDPFGSGGVQVDTGGSQAGGAGNLLLLGDQVMGTGGVDG